MGRSSTPSMQVPGAPLKQRLLEAALELASRQGFSGTSYQDMAARVGVTKQAVHYHFGDRTELLRGLVGPLVDDLERLVLRVETGAVAAGPEELLRRYLELLVDHRRLLRLVVEDLSVAQHPEVGPRIDRLHRRLGKLLARPEAGAAARVRAAAAVGALQRPLLMLPDIDLASLTAVVLQTAVAALASNDLAVPAPPRAATIKTAAVSASAGVVRRFVARTLSGWGVGDHVEVAVLLADELVSDVLRLADTDIEVTVRVTGSALRVEVSDGDLGLTVAGPHRATPGGRGALLVDALASAWGTERRGQATETVWFELRLP